MAFEHILVGDEGSISRLTLNRRDKLNAFAGRMRDEIYEGLVALGAAPHVPRCGPSKKGVDASLGRTLERTLDYEIESQLQCFASTDAREGVAAFFEKRPARFRGE